ncbi:hypothetical protein F511_20127 [Dorcoceras hygrometricum]|uniref:Uncharacterized protein n=1 Tax=Dorcoceras hygrometricum TaxID=472368 RepID=A0A2Z7AY57_9LAMI|nr:hypothetical protein F511_20127 [Dorcoceras hygrometricum]
MGESSTGMGDLLGSSRTQLLKMINYMFGAKFTSDVGLTSQILGLNISVVRYQILVFVNISGVELKHSVDELLFQRLVIYSYQVLVSAFMSVVRANQMLIKGYAIRLWRRPKLNQLEHINLADDEDQLQVLKCEVNQLVHELRSLLEKKKKIRVISTADESVSSRKDIIAIQEEEVSQDGAGAKKKFSRKTLRLYSTSRKESAVARFQQKRKRSSSRHESAGAKQLTIYEELRELDVNC